MLSTSHKVLPSCLLLLILSMLACSLPQQASPTPTNISETHAAEPTRSAAPATSPSVTITAPTPRPTRAPDLPDHRISTHRIYGIAGFYDQQTSQSFIPRGMNYAIPVPVLDHYEDRLFGVGVYDHNRTQADFKALSAAGYNTLRIVLDGCTSGGGCIGVENGEGLNPAYLDNIADLMKLAKENGLFLILASQELPELGGYHALANQGASDHFAAGRNTEILTSPGIQAAQKYWQDLLSGLIARGAPLDIVLGWELQAEQYYLSDQPPFSLEKGKVKPANSKTYDMANPAQKQALAVDGLRHYIDQLRQAILMHDQTAMVSMGFFAPDAPNPWREEDTRYVETAALLQDSALDFYDLHASPGMGLSLPELAENFGLDGHIIKPVIMGEVGTNTWIYPQVSQAAIVVQDWIAESCTEGFSGWQYSGYYPSPAGLWDASWGAIDEGQTILEALSPSRQPDACTTTVLPGRNLAQGKSVSVSATLPEQPPEMAVDGDQVTQWSAGAYPTQWIEIDLGAPYSVGEIRLTVGMWPSGETVHQLWIGSTLESMRLVSEFSGREYDYDVLNYVPAAALHGVRFVRVVTSESPSWVSWREIEVLAPFPSSTTPTPETTPTP